MPKKLSTNTKAVESRERKAAVQKDKNVAEDKRKADGKNCLKYVLFGPNSPFLCDSYQGNLLLALLSESQIKNIFN